MKKIDFVKIRVGLNILRRKYQDLFKIIDNILNNDKFPVVSEKEWELMMLPPEKEGIGFKIRNGLILKVFL